ncbi:MAG TPA: alginate O-acetyltransferase [Methylocystis sp.]|nr:alginate O-acetyltransferase [Methylocystis sp.]
MSQRLLERSPIFACAGFILFLFLANLWNFALDRDWPKLRIRSAQPLNGLTRPEPAPWTLEAFLNGETQRAVSANVGRLSPVFPISVRVKNQALYSLLGLSGAANLEIGPGGQLFGSSYLDEFCARGAPAGPARLDAWAEKVAETSSRAKELGKGFVYLFAPSKAAHAPEYIPLNRRCPALGADQTQQKLAPYRDALALRGVPFVDAARLLREASAVYPIDLFPRGGVHWNLLGAGLALREASRVLAAEPAGSPIGDYEFDWREDDEAKGVDRDLLDLLNLLWPDDHYPTAAIFRTALPGGCARAPKLLFVGDSFLREIIIAAAQAPCPPIIEHWFYAQNDEGGVGLLRFKTQPGETGNGERLVSDLALLPQSLLEADAILLEENEHNVMELNSVGNLYDAAKASKDERRALK